MNFSMAALSLFSLVTVAFDRPGEQRGCELTIAFGSYCCGTDSMTEQAIRTYLEKNRQVVLRSSRGGGIEGEHVWCLDARSKAAALDAFDAIRQLIPAYSDQAPTSVVLSTGERFETGWPRWIREPTVEEIAAATPKSTAPGAPVFGFAQLACMATETGERGRSMGRCRALMRRPIIVIHRRKWRRFVIFAQRR